MNAILTVSIVPKYLIFCHTFEVFMYCLHFTILSFILPARYQHIDRSPLCNSDVRYILPGHKVKGIKRQDL